MDRKLQITLKQTALFSAGWTFRVEVLDDSDQLVHQDEGRLSKLTSRTGIIDGAAVRLKLTASEREALALELETQWLKLYKLLMDDMAAGPSQRDAASLLADMPPETREAAEKLLNDSNLIDRIAADLEMLGIAGERETALALYLVGVSRLLEKPASARIYGHTASGKSFISEIAFSCFPPETVMYATQLTPQALFHLPNGSLKHRLIVGGERSQQSDRSAMDNTRALREMQTSGHLSKLTTARLGGETVTKHIEQDGPIAFVESTTLQPSTIFDEDLNRCLILRMDEGAEQTTRVLHETAKLYSGQVATGDRDTVREIHYALHRMLCPYQVVVPYAEILAHRMAGNRCIEVRRAFPQALAMIQAVTLLCQYQHADRDPLVATLPEYSIARRLLVRPLRELLGGGISANAIAICHKLRVRVGDKLFTLPQVVDWRLANKTTAWKSLNELAAVGSVQKIAEGEGNRADEWRLTDVDPEYGDLLPSAETIAGNMETQERTL